MLTVLLKVLIAAAVLIVLALAGYAAWLFWQVRQQAKQRDQMETAAADEIRQLGEDVLLSQVRSLKIFTHLVLQDEMNLTEGAIRIKVVLDHMLTACQREPYQAIYDLHEQTEHLARSEARQALPKQDRMRQDLHRITLETQQREAVLTAVKRLRDDMESQYPDVKVVAATSS